MSVLPGEGSHVILYGAMSFSVGTRTYSGYLARPDVSGSFPVGLVLGQLGSGAKELCRRLARHGIAAVALEPASDAVANDLLRWVRAPGTPWADSGRVVVVALGPGVAVGDAIGSAGGVVFLDAAELDARGRPALGLFGSDGDEAAAAREKRSSVPGSQWVFYADADNGFWDIGGDSYVEVAADDAIERIASFIHREAAA
jgi:hypothetical protein